MLISNLDIAEKWFIIAPCENSHCCWRWMAPLLWTAVWGKNLSSHKRGTSLYLLVRLIKWYGKPLYWAALLPVNRLLCSGLNSPPFQTVRRLKTGESSALNANAHWLTPLHVERDCQSAGGLRRITITCFCLAALDEIVVMLISLLSPLKRLGIAVRKTEM